jgi:hypothetical protein
LGISRRCTKLARETGAGDAAHMDEVGRGSTSMVFF